MLKICISTGILTALMDSTDNLVHDISMEVEILDEVCDTDNSLDSEVSCYDYQSDSFKKSDCSDDDHLCDLDTSFISAASSNSLYLPTPQKLAKRFLPVVPMSKKNLFYGFDKLRQFH